MTMNANLPPFQRPFAHTLLFLALATPSVGQKKCCMIDVHSAESACRFDPSSSSFVGPPLAQAKCLLRQVKIRGHLASPLDQLPGPLEELIGRRVAIELETFRRYLSSHQIAEADIGGDLSKPLSPADSTNPRGERARYFVIHDTSTPNYWSAIPPNINRETWSGNNFNRFDRSLTHVYVNRLGQSATVVDFESVLPRTKFGTKFACCLGERRKGLFIHVELVQPRHCDPTQGKCLPYKIGSDIASKGSNDNVGPTPGFTQAQMDRLALLYVAASLRKGEWLIPSFHAPMDATLQSAHDDPQNFDLAVWANSLSTLLSELGSPR